MLLFGLWHAVSKILNYLIGTILVSLSKFPALSTWIPIDLKTDDFPTNFLLFSLSFFCFLHPSLLYEPQFSPLIEKAPKKLKKYICKCFSFKIRCMELIRYTKKNNTDWCKGNQICIEQKLCENKPWRWNIGSELLQYSY